MNNLANSPAAEMPINDYHILPVTERQMRFAQALAKRSSLELPDEIRRDRRAMSAWIDANRPRDTSPFSDYPTGRQVAFAERIARLRRRSVPPECFRDKARMSDWIDRNR